MRMDKRKRLQPGSHPATTLISAEATRESNLPKFPSLSSPHQRFLGHAALPTDPTMSWGLNDVCDETVNKCVICGVEVRQRQKGLAAPPNGIGITKCPCRESLSQPHWACLWTGHQWGVGGSFGRDWDHSYMSELKRT